MAVFGRGKLTDGVRDPIDLGFLKRLRAIFRTIVLPETIPA
jgi:hypothetical protein